MTSQTANSKQNKSCVAGSCDEISLRGVEVENYIRSMKRALGTFTLFSSVFFIFVRLQGYISYVIFQHHIALYGSDWGAFVPSMCNAVHYCFFQFLYSKSSQSQNNGSPHGGASQIWFIRILRWGIACNMLISAQEKPVETIQISMTKGLTLRTGVSRHNATEKICKIKILQSFQRLH